MECILTNCSIVDVSAGFLSSCLVNAHTPLFRYLSINHTFAEKLSNRGVHVVLIFGAAQDESPLRTSAPYPYIVVLRHV